MIKTLLLFLFLIFCKGLYLKGQVVINPTKSSSAKKIDKKIDVVSNIPTPSTLGFIPSDVTNDRKNIKPSQEINTWLQSFADDQFTSSTDAKAKKLLWVIQDLSLGKDSTQKDVYSFVKLKADIYDNAKQNDVTYELVNTYDSTWIVKNTKADFGQMITDAFAELYEHSIQTKKSVANDRLKKLAEKYTGTKDEIVKNIKLTNNLQILKDSIYTTGIYTSFSEFKNNKPGIAKFYAKVDSQSNKVNLYEILKDSSSRIVEKAWGAAISNELYFYASNQLYPIERQGNTFYIAKYLEPRTRRNQGLYWRRYVGKQ